MKFAAVFALLALPIASVFAANYTVLVGSNGTLTYNPSSITGVVSGDVVAFQFMAKNHTVSQSTFTNPCALSPGGVNSGFMPVAANATQVPEWSFTVNNASAPLWFYCAQTGHCNKGMVFALNPTANKTFDAFQKAAMAAGGASSSSPYGGGGSPSATGGNGVGGASTVNPASSSTASTAAKAGAAARLSAGNSITAASLIALSGLLVVAL